MVRQQPVGSVILCRFCGESVKTGPKLDWIQEHAERCAPGRAKAAAEAAVAEARRIIQGVAGVAASADGTPAGPSPTSAPNRGGAAPVPGSAAGAANGNGSQGAGGVAQAGAGPKLGWGCCAPSPFAIHAGPKPPKRAKPGVAGGRRCNPSPPPSPPHSSGHSSGGGAVRSKRRGQEGTGGRGQAGSSMVERSSPGDASSAFAEWEGDSGSECGSDAERGEGGGRRSWGGVAGGGGILRATRRPLPPKKRWEADFEAWAQGRGCRAAGGQASEGASGASGAGGKGEGSPSGRGGGSSYTLGFDDGDGGVYRRYPLLVERARDSVLATVREVRVWGGGGGGGARKQETAADGVTGSGREVEAVVECRMVLEGSSEVREAAACSGCPVDRELVGGRVCGRTA